MYDQTPLEIAIENGYYDLVRYLLEEKKVDIFEFDNNNYSYLDIAISNNNFEIARLLIQNHANIQPSLLNALKQKNIEGVKFLIKQGGDVNYKYNEDKMTLLMYASKYGFFKLVKFLVEEKKNLNLFLNINAISIKNWTALMYAIESENTDIANYLIENGCIY